MPNPKRINVQFHRRFDAKSRNGQLFSWVKKQYPSSWDGILTAIGSQVFSVLRVAANGGSSSEIALAKKSALASISMRIDDFIDYLPEASFAEDPKEGEMIAPPDQTDNDEDDDIIFEEDDNQ